MAYSELVKNFNRIRDYMREFYIYGLRVGKSIGEKVPAPMMMTSAYRKLAGGYMGFRQNAGRKECVYFH